MQAREGNGPFSRHFRELGDFPYIYSYGLFLALGHVLTAYYWLGSPVAWRAAGDTMCWPQLPGCAAWALGAAFFRAANVAYLVVSLTAAVAFLRHRSPLGAVGILFAATALKAFLFVQDYRLMGNYHYMHFLVLVVYFVSRNRRAAIPVLLCAFYFVAGTLKLNREWLQGAALVSPSFLHGPPLRFLLAYAVVFELLVVWALLAKRRAWFGVAAAHVVAFHLFSWHIVGYFYPCMMLCLLAIFPLARLALSPWEFSGFRHALPATAAFFLAQLPPYFLSADSAVTGEGRLFSLNMLDASVECEHFAFARFKDHVEELSRNRYDVGVRIRCDPIVYWNAARSACRELSARAGFEDLDVQLVSKRSTDPAFHRVIDIRGFCSADPAYRTWARNDWVRFDPVVDNAGRFHASAATRATSSYRGGPARDSQAPWAGGPRLETAWRLRNGNIGIHTASKASPAADSSGVYVGGDSGWFYAYDLEGRQRWRFLVSEAVEGIHSTAALDESSVYVGAYNGRLYRLAKSTGRVEWVLPLGQAIGASPLLVGDHLYVNVELAHDGYLAKVERATGRVVWKSPRYGEQSHSSPALDPASGFLLLGANNQALFAFREADGALAWRQALDGPVKSTPLVENGIAYVSSKGGQLNAYRVATGALAWSTRIGGTFSSPTRVPGSGMLVLGTFAGELLGVDARTGAIRWRRSTGGLKVMGSGLGLREGAAGSVLIACGPERLCELDAGGRVLQELPLDADLDGVPVAVGSAVFVSEKYPGGLVKLRSGVKPRLVSNREGGLP